MRKKISGRGRVRYRYPHLEPPQATSRRHLGRRGDGNVTNSTILFRNHLVNNRNFTFKTTDL